MASALAEILDSVWCATDGLVCQASEEEGRMDAHRSPEKLTIRGQLLTGFTACEMQLPMWWEPGTQKFSELFLFNDRGCARPCYSVAQACSGGHP